MDKNTIAAAFSQYGTDKGPRRHNYQQAYSSIFGSWSPQSLLEIGVLEGASLAAWKHLFPEAIVNGIEHRPKTLIEAAANIPVFQGDSTNKEFIDSVVTTSYDVIIDDGDHRPDVMWKTFLNLEDKWTKHYVFEDVCVEENEKILRKRLQSRGYRNIHTWNSSFNDPKTNLRGVVQVKGEMIYPPFYIVIVTRE